MQEYHHINTKTKCRISYTKLCEIRVHINISNIVASAVQIFEILNLIK